MDQDQGERSIILRFSHSTSFHSELESTLSSEAELIAVIFGNGNYYENAINLAKILLENSVNPR
jgi:hypothetical protein